MRVTICQWPVAGAEIAAAWRRLTAHARTHASELVVLPEMPFSAWIADSQTFDPEVWAAAVAAHDAWEDRFSELGDTALAATRPVDFGNERYNEGFIHEAGSDARAAHVKASLADEAGARESIWYHAASAIEFTPQHIGAAAVGFLIGGELWMLDQARAYAAEGVQLLITPRVRLGAASEQWLAAGRQAARLARAFGLSSSRATGESEGAGWIIDPTGEVVALTTARDPFVTLDVDLGRAERTAPAA